MAGVSGFRMERRAHACRASAVVENDSINEMNGRCVAAGDEGDSMSGDRCVHAVWTVVRRA